MRYLERMENHRDTGWRHEALHLLYRPASLGRTRRYRVRFGLLHRVHLIPGRWMDASCARRDAERRFLSGPPAVTVPPPRPLESEELQALRRRAHP